MRTFLKLGDRLVDFDKIARVELDAADDEEGAVFIHTDRHRVSFYDQDASILRGFFGQGEAPCSITTRPGACQIIDLTPVDEPAPQFAAEPEPVRPAPEGKLAVSKLTEHDIAKLITGCLESAGLGKFEIFSFSPLNAVELDADQEATRVAAEESSPQATTGAMADLVREECLAQSKSLRDLARGYVEGLTGQGISASEVRDIAGQIVSNLARIAVEAEVAAIPAAKP
ncbi:hypothetical protein [Singulisphaera sp. PoT]|uniref:hypothetical protein n=1 Tax=Singulisphaera sp. PoT TaxID=3411797 RepID=UPI003BF49F28